MQLDAAKMGFRSEAGCFIIIFPPKDLKMEVVSLYDSSIRIAALFTLNIIRFYTCKIYTKT